MIDILAAVFQLLGGIVVEIRGGGLGVAVVVRLDGGGGGGRDG